MPTTQSLKKHLFFLTLIILVGAFSLKILLKSGFPQGHDTLWHTERITAMFNELKNGQFPVRWTADLDNAYGVPLFNFIYPGPYYLGALGMFLGLGSVAMLKLLTVFFYILGGTGVYLIFRKQPFIGLVASLIYLFTPYQFVNIFVRQAFGEIAVLGLIPWAILAAKNIEVKGKLHWYHPIPLALALVSHNFLGMFAVGIIILYTLIGKHKKSHIHSILLSLGLAAFFLIPMIFERQHLYSTSEGDFSFNYQDHFVYPKQLLYSKWDYWYSVPGDGDTMSFQLGFANILSIILACGSLIILKLKTFKTKLIKKEIALLSIITFGSVLIMIPMGKFIWELIPVLQVMQFPWRMLALTTISTSLIAGLTLLLIFRKHKIATYIIGFVLVALAIINTRNYHRPMRMLSDEEYLVQHLIYVDKTATSRRTEIVPKWSLNERWEPSNPQMIGERIAKYEGELELIELDEKNNETTFRATSITNQSKAIIHRNYFPSWQATKDDLSIDLSPSETGDIIVPLSAGDHIYHVYIESTPTQKIANIISALSIVYLLFIAIRKSAK